MVRSKNINVGLIFLFLFSVLQVLDVIPAQASTHETDISTEEEIKSVIESYFELRYLSLSNLVLEDFTDLIATSQEGISFWEEEKTILEIRLKHAQFRHLGYLEYDFFLDYKDISLDAAGEEFIVLVVEGHNVIFEISEELSPEDPIVSSMRNLVHKIILRKEGEYWRIESDLYGDYLWRMIRDSNYSPNGLLNSLQEPQELITLQVKNLTGPVCSLDPDESSHPYDRIGAVAYAHQWAEAAPPYNSPPYDDFSNLGGDCTNFVNQAIHEGSDAEMFGSDTLGWYFNNISDYSPSWTDVNFLYDLILNYKVWPRPIDDPDGPGGPEGCEVLQNQVESGDLIQYDWTEDGYWDHSVIIVNTLPDGLSHLVASHSPDKDDYPFTDFIYENPDMVYRFIRIDRIDGYGSQPSPTTPPPPTETPTPPPNTSTIFSQIQSSAEDAGTEPGECNFTTNNNEIYIGECTNGNLIISGFRFREVAIPQGAIIQEAYLEFTVDGTYSVPITIRINGQNSGNAIPFNFSDRPAARPTTAASTNWGIPSSDVWVLGDNRRSPEMKAIVQEIVSRPDWEPYNGMAFIINTLSSGAGQHRRVIAYDRPEWYPGSEYAARLYITYEGAPLPSPSPSPPPPTPTPTPTAPPSPSPPPEPTCIFNNILSSSSAVSKAEELAPRSTGTPTVNTLTTSERLVKAVDLAEFAVLLYQVRDEYLSQTQQGINYTELYYEHTKDIAHILINDNVLYQQGYEIMKSLEPALIDLLDGNGDLKIAASQVSEIQSFLDGLVAQAQPALQEAIQAEREDRSLESLIGLSFTEAWNHLSGYNLEWLPPLSEKDPYDAQINSKIPIKFSIKTQEGKSFKDETVWLQVVDENGLVVIDPIGLGKSPSKEIDFQGKKYHFNLETKDLEPGLYTLEVYYNSVEPGEPAVKNLLVKEK